MANVRRPAATLVVISQVYPPDPTSVGQHVQDAAVEMVRRGYRVIVYTANRGYEDPSKRFSRHELRDGVIVRRLPFSSFGKSSIAIRILGGVLFTLQASVRCLFVQRMRLMLVSTSPPMAGVAAVVVGAFRKVAVTFWAMDLNPDQMVALGKASPNSLSVRLFNSLNRRILKRSRAIIALDRFMAERIERKANVAGRIAVMPPWPHEDHIESIAHQDNPFRKEQGLEGKTVIMYSGNLSLASPVTTIIEAAKRVEDLPDLLFLFIGGGVVKKELDDLIARESPPNIRTLPYQPIESLRYSLSAADVHLVSVGEDIVGISHPCKIYGAMAVSRPILCLSPRPSHATDIVDGANVGWSIEHGDVDGAEAVIREIYRTPQALRLDMGRRAREIVDRQFTKAKLCRDFCDVVEFGPQPDQAVALERPCDRRSTAQRATG